VVENWTNHSTFVSGVYRKRRDVFIIAANKHLTGLAEWSTPTAGMFCWMKLNCLEGKNGEPDKDSTHLVKTTLANAKVWFGFFFS
jgi:tryptophan aminotransferase